jgi:hypothetical protein
VPQTFLSTLISEYALVFRAFFAPAHNTPGHIIATTAAADDFKNFFRFVILLTHTFLVCLFTDKLTLHIFPPHRFQDATLHCL